MSRAKRDVIPGFGLTMGFTLAYLSLIVLLPLSMLALWLFRISPERAWQTLTSSRTVAAFGLSAGGALIAAVINGVFGTLVAWVLVRYRFPGRRVLDALVDLPLALPTAVAGIALTAVYAPNGILGVYLERIGIQAAYSRLGVVLAMLFVGVPFVVRSVQPVLADLDADQEEAASVLGASRIKTFVYVHLPAIAPAVLSGVAIAFARGLGEYGSVVFISGNMPGRTEIAPLLIMTRLEEFDYAAASVLAVAMLAVSFAMLLAINFLQTRSRRDAIA